MWKNGQNEAEHSTWMQQLTGQTVHRWWSELLSVAPSGQKTKQSEVAGEYVRRRRTGVKTIKNGRPGLRMAVRRKSVPLPRLSLRPIG